jgi:hypothetical protein
MAAKSSPAPLFLTVGFAAGLGFGYLAFHEEKSKTYIAPPLEVKAAPVQRDAGTLASLEVTFQRWGGYAVWENDLTEIAGWDPRRRKHADFYEVRRADGKFYFRSIPALTRPLIDHGPRSALPFAFTETQEMREKFYRENPDYDPTREPVVDLPPKPPERYAPEAVPEGKRAGVREGVRLPTLTSGAGG